MALILDKSIVTTTYYDVDGYETTGSTISGTTVTGLTNLTYEDPSGIIHDNPYLVVDEVFINKNNKYIKIKTFIFKDNTGRNDNKHPIFEDAYMINDDELYDTYFLIENMLNVNIFKASYKYLEEQILTNWKSDE